MINEQNLHYVNYHLSLNDYDLLELDCLTFTEININQDKVLSVKMYTVSYKKYSQCVDKTTSAKTECVSDKCSCSSA